MQSGTGSRRQGGPILQLGFPRRNADVETSSSNFRHDAEGPQISWNVTGDGDFGDLEGIWAWGQAVSHVMNKCCLLCYESGARADLTGGPLGSFSSDKSGVASGPLRLAPKSGAPTRFRVGYR